MGRNRPRRAAGNGEIHTDKSHTCPHFFVLTRKRLTLLALQYLSAITGLNKAAPIAKYNF